MHFPQIFSRKTQIDIGIKKIRENLLFFCADLREKITGNKN
jgi:hypothetical protein